MQTFGMNNNSNPPGGNGGNGGGGMGGMFGIPGAVTPQQAQQNATISDILIDYNAAFAKGTPAKYRDKEIFDVISYLMMSQKCCALLVGAPGVGKTKIVEEIARLIAQQSPYTEAINDYKVYELPITNLVAGTEYRGQMEEKLQKIIEWCENNKVILFIDEIHQLCGDKKSDSNIAQALKPAMARGKIRIIGATTLQESKTLLDDPAFNRRFNRVNVPELTIEQTEDIIKSVYIPKFANFYGIGFSTNIEHDIVVAAEKNKTMKNHRPDNAITLLDRICSGTVLQRNYNISQATDEALKDTLKGTPVVINILNIDAYTKSCNYQLPESFDAVKKSIFYRDDVIEKAYDSMKDFVEISNVFPDSKPHVIRIEGEECSGRTTFAMELAKTMDEEPVYIDLSDYIDHTSLTRIIGASAGYIGYDSKKEMPFDIVESNPRKFIILDNFDKCHITVREFFNATLGSGKVTYADNHVVDISKSIVILISENEKKSHSMGFITEEENESMTNIVIDKLTQDEMIRGTEQMIDDMVKELKNNHQKYSKLPDHTDLSEEDKAKLVTASDMKIVAKHVILSMILTKKNTLPLTNPNSGDSESVANEEGQVEQPVAEPAPTVISEPESV